MTAPRSGVGAWDSAFHAPALVDEVVQLLAGSAGGGAPARRVLDCTLGGGGHSAALLDAGAEVVGVDRDPDAIAAARTRLADFEQAGRFRAYCVNYAQLDRVDALADARFDGILLDLGISSHQIDDLGRGFSFREGATLDMRMGADAAATAAD